MILLFVALGSSTAVVLAQVVVGALESYGELP